MAITITTANAQIKQKPRYLVKDLYIADPSAHLFNGKIYVYPSHDIEAGIPENDKGDHFDMRDYHVFSMENIDGKVTDHGVVLDVKQVPWAGRQMWAPDAAFKNGKYYLYFPAKDKTDIFRIGVAKAINLKVHLNRRPTQSSEVSVSTRQFSPIPTGKAICILEGSGEDSCSVTAMGKPLNVGLNLLLINQP